MKSLLIILSILVSTKSLAQNQYVGVKAGTNLTKIFSDDFLVPNLYRNGLHAGLSYDYQFNKRWIVGTELLYTQKGFRDKILYTDETGNVTGESATVLYNYDYLSLPLKGGIVFGNKFSGFVNIGIVPSILIDAKTITPGYLSFFEEKTYNVTSRVNRFDIGGLFEIGLNYKITPDFLITSAIGYQHSITSITNKNYFANSEIRHYGASFSLGLKYALKKSE